MQRFVQKIVTTGQGVDDVSLLSNLCRPCPCEEIGTDIPMQTALVIEKAITDWERICIRFSGLDDFYLVHASHHPSLFFSYHWIFWGTKEFIKWPQAISLELCSLFYFCSHATHWITFPLICPFLQKCYLGIYVRQENHKHKFLRNHSHIAFQRLENALTHIISFPLFQKKPVR